MIDIVRALLEASPLLALFLAIATGYAIGQISIAGVSFGAGAVLFTGLIIRRHCAEGRAAGAGRNPRPPVRVWGGHPVWAAVLHESRGPGFKYIGLANAAVIASLLVALLLAEPAVSAGNRGRTVRRLGHQHADLAGGARRRGQPGSCDRLFGRLSVRRGGTDCPDDHHGRAGQTQVRSASQNVRLAELTLEVKPGRTVGELSATLPADVKIVAVRQHHVNAPPVAETRLQEGDGLLLVGSPTSIEQAKASMGREEPGRLSRDRANLDVVRVYVSAASSASRFGTSLPDFPSRFRTSAEAIFELVASSDLTIEFGDRLVVAVPVGRQAEVPPSATASRAMPNVLRLDRCRDGARAGARHDPGTLAGRRNVQLGRGRRAARHGACPRLARPHGTDRLENAGGCQPGAAESGPVGVHRIGRHRRRSALRADVARMESRSSSVGPPSCSPWS